MLLAVDMNENASVYGLSALGAADFNTLNLEYSVAWRGTGGMPTEIRELASV